ncbi:MAG TPA: family 16 glycosylhydrolase [Noviherbaspirillum sp.]|jgi:beta-glucanase (GH16 family)|uniref:family 16 glycosylhydrolase n=1 Tax=Noviherbaspirillum sp. TaxID=1926288 RepID=UPI002DDCAC3B|nr:family 16 glycosylhydrolase [Noviherbaspirillum sp.]HEV2611030.1 family 16 glycosylhydrolase [Noviherbaspirillum sp.]
MAAKTNIKALLAVLGMTIGLNANAQMTNLFFDDFSGKGGLGDAWEIATWVNGHPFGCTFSNQEVSRGKGALSLGFSGNSGKCAEVRTRRSWQYGRFVVDMKPANVPGSVSSFFLYDGAAATSTHHEIDIEFIGGTSLLHTNYWIAGRQYPVDVDLAALGIDPYQRSRQYSFTWRPDSIVWHVMDDTGRWTEIRREYVTLAAPMKLMMNAWYGDNLDSALHFPGYYDGTSGKAQYSMVRIGQ